MVLAVKNADKRRLYREESSDDDDEDSVLSSDFDDEDDDPKPAKAKIVLPVEEKENKENDNRKKKLEQRRRRRSSARFLRLSDRQEQAEGEETTHANDADKQEKLAEMYRQAIRLNAENRINAGNSWSLSLIDHLDKFLGDEQEDHPLESKSKRKDNDRKETTQKEKKINFTKASCTLDASVKIYSYRVDDVHLTSYKVLANLNRTDQGKKNSSEDAPDGESAKPSHVGERKQSERRGCADTLETNIENLNINTLEQEYDIDPLFHKMSKTFDEGGAKGLLLNNLGVSSTGCNIVFDSKDCDYNPQDDVGPETEGMQVEPMEVDISGLVAKLDSMLNGAPVSSLPFVPQLVSLRAEHAALDAEGFVDDSKTKQPKRYEPDEQEEKEAEESIHLEHLERSRMSATNLSNFDNSVADFSGFVDNDFGGDGDNDVGDVFGGMDIELGGGGDPDSSFFGTQGTETEYVASEKFTAPTYSKTGNFLDLICNKNVIGSGNEYHYFNQAFLEKLTAGNLWAGAAHWKRSVRAQPKRPSEETPSTKKPKKEPKTRTFLEISSPITDFQSIITHKTAKKGSKNDPLQLSQATKNKQQKNDNLLPFDANIGIGQLTQLFLRPNAAVNLVAGFCDEEQIANYEYDDGADIGGDEEGQGFLLNQCHQEDFAEIDDFEVQNLEGIRKVDKVEVGYAKVSKKVDVKQLKHDLWAELEVKTGYSTEEKEENKDESTEDPVKEENDPDEPMQISSTDETVSFKETVHKIDISQAQNDVTLPFYFICLLHLANEKGLKLESTGGDLTDIFISCDHGAAPSFGTLPNSQDSVGTIEDAVPKVKKERRTKQKKYVEESDDDELDMSEDEDAVVPKVEKQRRTKQKKYVEESDDDELDMSEDDDL